jgi:hypothetical protein
MQTQHGIAITGVAAAGVDNGMTGLEVDGRQQYSRAASLTGSLYNGIAVCIKLLAVQVAVGVDVRQIEN